MHIYIYIYMDNLPFQLINPATIMDKKSWEKCVGLSKSCINHSSATKTLQINQPRHNNKNISGQVTSLREIYPREPPLREPLRVGRGGGS